MHVHAHSAVNKQAMHAELCKCCSDKSHIRWLTYVHVHTHCASIEHAIATREFKQPGIGHFEWLAHIMCVHTHSAANKQATAAMKCTMQLAECNKAVALLSSFLFAKTATG